EIVVVQACGSEFVGVCRCRRVGMPEISRALRSDIGTAGIGGLAVGIVTALRVRIRRIRALRIRVVARLAIRIITTLGISIRRGEIKTLYSALSTFPYCIGSDPVLCSIGRYYPIASPRRRHSGCRGTGFGAGC